MSTRKNSWCPREIKSLKTLYFMGASDDDISMILKRTPQSINKKITRLKIRPQNTLTHIVRPGCYIPAFETRHDLLKSMQKVIQSVDSQESDQDLLRKYPPKKSLKRQVNKIAKEKKTTLKENGQWRSLEEIVLFLGQHKYSVASLGQPPEHMAGYSHILKGQPVRASHLLIEANKIQGQLGKPLFYLEETTEE